MHPDLTGLMTRSNGLVTRRQALARGVSASEIRELLRVGSWEPVRRGVYADRAVWDAASPWRGQPLLRARAALLTLGGEWVLCHDSAAHALGLDVLAPETPRVHLTRPGLRRGWSQHGVVVHAAPYHPAQVVEVDGLRCLSPARTAVDLARTGDLQHALVSVDAAMRRGVSRAVLEETLAAMSGWPGTGRARTTIALGDAGAESGAESLARILVRELGLTLAPGEPETQFPLQLPSGVRWCDLRVGRHMFEVDGLLKYRPVVRGGYADRPVEKVVMDEKQREREVQGAELGVSRIFWQDFWGEERVAARARLRADVEITRRRFGDELPEHLVRNAVRIRAAERDRAA